MPVTTRAGMLHLQRQMAHRHLDQPVGIGPVVVHRHLRLGLQDEGARIRMEPHEPRGSRRAGRDVARNPTR